MFPNVLSLLWSQSILLAFSPVSLSDDLLGPDPLVDRPGVLLVDHELVEDVDPVLLALLEVVVDDQATEAAAERLHSLPDSLLRSLLPPVSIIIIWK